jgi:hypothetical protein
MTDDRTLERAARSWLEEGPTRAPDRAVDAALSRIQTTRQERDLRIPWRLPTMNRYLLPIAAALIVAIGAVYLITRPASNIGPPATATPTASPSGPASIEGTWDVEYTRQEMLAAGIADEGEDNPGNYGHFRLTLEAGRWRMVQLSPTTGGGGVSTYTLADGVVRLYSADDDATFDITYTVTETTLTFGRGGPVGFRVKPWTRVAAEPVPTAVAGPIAEGTYLGPTLQVADIVAMLDADSTLTPADRDAILDDIWGIRSKTTFRVSIAFAGGQFIEREALDGQNLVGSFGTYAFPDDQTLVLTEFIDNADVLTVFEVSVDGDSFSLHRTSPSHDVRDEFVTRKLFESGPFTLR